MTDRLATYGTLGPGRANRHQLAGLAGRWTRGTVLGRLVQDGWGAALGFPALVLDKSVFGGEMVVLTYADAHNVQEPSEADHVMWGQVASADGFRIMAFDMPSGRPWSPGEAPFFVSVSSRSDEEITTRWERLRAGGTVHPLAPAAWAPLYGMLKDRFGITWVFAVNGAHPS